MSSSEPVKKTKTQRILELMSDGHDVDYIMNAVGVERSTVFCVKRVWLDDPEIKSVAKFKIKYPGLSDEFYEGLLTGRFDESIIRVHHLDLGED